MKMLFWRAALLLVLVAACASDSLTPIDESDKLPSDAINDGVPKYEKPYDSLTSKLQITLIAYNQAKNAETLGDTNEWIEFRSSRTLVTKGWTWNAGDPSQSYALPDTIFKFYRVYTRAHSPIVVKYEKTLALNQWIWNNSEADTARVFDDTGAVVDMLSY
jgi:hypothetical protein